MTAQASTPLQTHDLNPLTLFFGLPLASPATLEAEQHQWFSASLNISNTLNVETSGNEYLFIDGETQQLNLSYLYGISENWNTRLRLSFVRHSAGFLDDLIDSYHQSFGFLEGDRPLYSNDNLLFQYQDNGTDLLYFNSAGQDPGNLNIEFAYRLHDNASSSASLWFGVKVPLGDSDSLASSNGTDIYAWYAYDQQLSADWSHYYNIGLLFTGNSDILAEIQQHEIVFGTAGVEWRYFKSLTLNMQLDFHSRFYDSNTDFLGDSIQLSSGMHIKINPRSQFEFALIEDIQVGASPDVTFEFSLSHRF